MGTDTAWKNDGESALLRISDHLRVRYAKSGDGPPLLLLHTIAPLNAKNPAIANSVARRGQKLS